MGKNKIFRDGDISYILLNGIHGFGKKAIIDTKNINKINSYNWHMSIQRRKTKLPHAIIARKKIDNKWKCFLIHRLILCIDDPIVFVDHIDSNVLNNLESNLRICSNSENLRNMHNLRKEKTSRFKGVILRNDNKKYRARIRVNGVLINIGSFKDEISAAKAYDEYAIKYFGEFACTNAMLGLL